MIFLKIEIKSYKNLINLLFIFININFVFFNGDESIKFIFLSFKNR